MPQFFFGWMNFFSGQTIYDSFIYQLFNIFYTSCPIMIYAIIDKEFNPMVLVENKLNYYSQGMKKALFDAKIFWKWFFFGALNAFILTMFSFYSLNQNFATKDGHTQELWEAGCMIFGQCILIANMKILGFSHTFNIFSILIIICSLILYVLSLLIINLYYTSDLYQKIYPLLRTPNFHLGNFLIICFTCSIDSGFEMYRSPHPK